MALWNKFQTHFRQLLPHQPNLVVALSGGLDSVVLLYLLTQIQPQLNVRAIHVHHGLSPNADSWATFCEELCAQFSIPLTVCRVQLESRANLEAHARQARYQAIRHHLQPNEILLTAHHLDDQAETFLLALKRGSGVKGLGAMAEISHAHGFALCRPLLPFSKAELRAFAEQHALRWVEDESNQSSDFERNFLRNEILPKLNTRWAHFNQMVLRTSQHCAQQQALLEELLADELNKRVKNDKNLQSLDIDGFASFSHAKQQQLVRLWLACVGALMPTSAQLAEIITKVICAEADKNPQLKLGEQILRRHQQQLFLTPIFADTAGFVADLPEKGEVQLPDQIGTIQREGGKIICRFLASNDRLQLPKSFINKPLQVRLGVTGKVKWHGKTQREEMKKIWQQHNVPVWLRSRTPLIFSDDCLIGVMC